MATSRLIWAVLASGMAFLPLPGQRTTARSEASTLVVARPSKEAPRSLPNPRGARPHPPRLTSSEYVQLLPPLASQLNVQLSKLAPSPIASSTLATPGGVLNIPIGGALPPGAEVDLSGGSMHLRPLGTTPSWANWEVGGGAPKAGEFGTMVVCTFYAPIPGAGSYLMILYLDTTLPQVSFQIMGYSSNNLWLEGSSGNLVKVNNGKAMVAWECTNPGSRKLCLMLAQELRVPGQTCTVYSCDFIRVK